MSAEQKVRIAVIEAPYRREIWLDDVQFDSGMRLLRITIKEGRRFTQLDLDSDTAERWAQIMRDWARNGGKNPAC
ncbi:MAG: hypothetical protein K8H87_01575 [Pseudorhodoplanes sp.]|nr:hypothetical protein [Pseudorhodoplanes sp.]